MRNKVKLNEEIGFVKGINGAGKQVLFSLTLKDVKHIRRCLNLYQHLHPTIEPEHGEDILKRFKTFGRRSLRTDYKTRFKKNNPRICKECKSKKDLEIDHVIPLTDGGSNKQENLQWLCKICHNKKNTLWRIKLKESEIEKLKKQLKEI